MKEKLRQAVERYLAISERHGVIILVAALLLGAVGAYGATRVRVDAQVERLLPAETPSAQAVRELQERTSVEGPLYLLVTSSSPALNRQLARRLREAVERWPETLWAIDRRDPECRPWCWCQFYDTTVDQNYVGWDHGTQNWVDAVRNTDHMVLTHP